MRSRYSAYVVGDADHVFRTWHPRTRPRDLTLPDVDWQGLEVVRTLDGGPDDDTGVVEFEARSRDAAGEHVLHETSRFVRRAGRWVYVDGDLHA
jgi:SEC-C motif domain protein